MDQDKPETGSNPFADDELIVAVPQPAGVRSAKHGRWLLLIVILVVSAWLYIAVDRSSRPIGRTRFRSSVPQVELPPAEAWNGDSDLPSPEHKEGVKQLFDTIVDALRRDDAKTLAGCFDFPRLHRASLSQGADAVVAAEKDDVLIELASQKIPKGLLQEWSPPAFENYEIKRCVTTASGTEVCVYIVHHDEVVGREKIRWWLARTDGRWRIYDLEDLQFGMRMSSEMAAGLTLGAKLAGEGSPVYSVAENFMRLRQTMAALRSQDVLAAERHVSRVRIDMLPEGFKTLALVLRAAIDVELGRPQEAIGHLDKAARYRRDAPAMHLVRAMAENDLDEPQNARRAAEAYLEDVGDDADGYYQLGRAYTGMDDSEQAAKSLRKALQDDPQHVESLFLLGAILEPDEIGELRRRFRQIKDPDEWFPWLCENFLDSDCGDGFEIILKAHHQQDPKDANCRYYMAWLNDDWIEMVRLYEEEITESDALDPATTYRPTLAYALYKLGRPLEAIEKFRPINEVYNQMATLAAHDEDGKILERINQRFESLDGSDPRLILWQAESHWLKKDYSKTLSLLMDNRQSILTAEETEEQLARRVILCLVQLEMWSEAEDAAVNWYNGCQDPWYAALVYAAWGDVEHTRDWIEKCVEAGYPPAYFYLDPIMGPALRSKAFESLREKYPEPKQRTPYGPPTAGSILKKLPVVSRTKHTCRLV